MHFLTKDRDQPVRDLAYWRDLGLGTLGAVCIIGGGVRFWDWIKEHRPIDRDWALGFALAYTLIALLAPRRFRYIFYSLVTIIGWGILGAISHLSLLGLPVILLCAVVVYWLLRWKGHLLK